MKLPYGPLLDFCDVARTEDEMKAAFPKDDVHEWLTCCVSRQWISYDEGNPRRYQTDRAALGRSRE